MDSTSLFITVDHVVGSLNRVLDVFTKHGINLTKIESRPAPQPHNYSIYIEAEINPKALDDVVTSLEKMCVRVTTVGGPSSGEKGIFVKFHD